MRRFALALTLAAWSTMAHGKPKEPERAGGVRLAFVLLEKAALPRAKDVVAAYRKFAKKDALAITADEDKETVQLAFASGATVLVQLMPAPVPNHEADNPFEHSITSLGGTRRLRPHRAFLVVASHGEPHRSAEELARFTHVLAGVVKASKAIGVYWGDARATHEAKMFLEKVGELSDPLDLLPLWTGFEVVPMENGRVSMLTFGIRRQLGILDLRITAPKARAAEMMDVAFMALAYAVKRGAAVPDGERIGLTEKEIVTVRHEPSPVAPDETVWRVDLP